MRVPEEWRPLDIVRLTRTGVILAQIFRQFSPQISILRIHPRDDGKFLAARCRIRACPSITADLGPPLERLLQAGVRNDGSANGVFFPFVTGGTR